MTSNPPQPTDPPTQMQPTHRTAIVIIPPESLWPPIQAIRQRHDRQFHRWMPHINLIYPFRPRCQFDALTPRLQQAVALLQPFELALASLRHFQHGPRSFTLWLEPTPPEPIRHLQQRLQEVVPDCDHQSRYPGGYTPHLSIGQVRDPRTLEPLKARLRSALPIIHFRVQEAAIIWRGPQTGHVFVPDRTLRLASPSRPA